MGFNSGFKRLKYVIMFSFTERSEGVQINIVSCLPQTQSYFCDCGIFLCLSHPDIFFPVTDSIFGFNLKIYGNIGLT